MTPRETSKSYDKLAPNWDSSSFDHTNGIAQHRRALQFLETKILAIDIGCGSSGRFIDLLIGEGFEVEGLDISSEMLRLAKKRHPQNTFYHADICDWRFPKNYDFISAWDSIWHAPLEKHEAVLRNLCGALSHGGVLIFTSGGIDQAGESSNPCHGVPLYHATLGIPGLLAIIADCDCICRHLEYDQHPETHIYLVVQKI